LWRSILWTKLQGLPVGLVLRDQDLGPIFSAERVYQVLWSVTPQSGPRGMQQTVVDQWVAHSQIEEVPPRRRFQFGTYRF